MRVPELMMSVEEAFGVQVEDNEIMPEDFQGQVQ